MESGGLRKRVMWEMQWPTSGKLCTSSTRKRPKEVMDAQRLNLIVARSVRLAGPRGRELNKQLNY